MTFMQTNEREGYGKFKATIKANRYSSAFMRAYLIKKLQFNNIVILKNKVAHGSVIITMDKLKSSRIVKQFIYTYRRLSIGNIE